MGINFRLERIKYFVLVILQEDYNILITNYWMQIKLPSRSTFKVYSHVCGTSNVYSWVKWSNSVLLVKHIYMNGW